MQSWHRALLSKAASAQLCQGQGAGARQAGHGHTECQGQGFTACSRERPQQCVLSGTDSASPPALLGSRAFPQQPGIPTAFVQLEKGAMGKVSVQPRAARCLPVSITSTQGREGLNGTAGSPNSLSLSSHSTEDELALLTSPATPCIQEQAADSPGGGSKTQPRSRNTMPELNLASQCHLWGAAHSSASCTAPGQPGSCSGPPSHTAGCSCPSASLQPHHGCTEKHPHTAGLAA